ncbi:MAG: DUF4907 domain-containing protein [Prolixibacteraceae bacterium]
MIDKKRIIVIGLILIATIITIVLYTKSPGSKEAGTSAIQAGHLASLNVYEIEGGWAYEVKIDTSVMLFQEQIPGMPNNVKFSTKADALKCGKLVMQKLKKQQRPSISKTELDSLKISY